MKKILIVIPFGIGDALFTTPMIAALQEKFLGVEVSYLTSGRAAPLFMNDSRLTKVFSYDRDEFVAVYRHSPWQFLLKWKRFVDEIRSEEFDTAFDLSLNSGIGFALKLAGIPRRIGYDYKGRGRFLTERVTLKRYAGRHVAEYYLALLGARGAGKRTGVTLFISPTDAVWAGEFLREQRLEGAGLVAIYPGGGASWGKGAGLKRWSPENYAKLADKIVEKEKCAIILMGDKGETELCQSVAGEMTNKPVVVAGQTSLGQAAALMKHCRFVIANDGGPLHVAVALGLRTVSIFGPVDEHVYGPFLNKGHVVVTKELPCRPCYRNFRMTDCRHISCLKTLTVDEVFRKVVGVL